MDTPNNGNGDVMTIDQMQTTLKRDERSLTEAVSGLQAAESTYEGRTRRAAHSSDESAAIARRDFLPPVVAAEQAAARAGTAAEANIRQILAQTATTTRMTVSAEIEARAAAKVPILGRLIETASLPQLRDELKAAVISNDTAAIYVMASLLPGRLAGEAPLGQATGRPEVDAARAEIARLVGRVKDELRDTSLDPIRAQAGAVLEKAATARRAADRRRQQDAARARIDAGEIVAWPT